MALAQLMSKSLIPRRSRIIFCSVCAWPKWSEMCHDRCYDNSRWKHPPTKCAFPKSARLCVFLEKTILAALYGVILVVESCSLILHKDSSMSAGCSICPNSIEKPNDNLYRVLLQTFQRSVKYFWPRYKNGHAFLFSGGLWFRSTEKSLMAELNKRLATQRLANSMSSSMTQWDAECDSKWYPVGMPSSLSIVWKILRSTIALSYILEHIGYSTINISDLEKPFKKQNVSVDLSWSQSSSWFCWWSLHLLSAFPYVLCHRLRTTAWCHLWSVAR